MEIHIAKEKENPILMRKEVEGEVMHEEASTPSKQDIITALSTKYRVKDTHIDLKYVVSKKGRNKAEFVAFIYSKPIKEEVKEEEKKEEGEKEEEENKEDQVKEEGEENA